MRARIADHVIRMPVIVEVSYGRDTISSSGNGEDLVCIRRIHQCRSRAATRNVNFVTINGCPDTVPWRRHVGLPTPAVSHRIVDFHLGMENQSLGIFSSENPKLAVYN